MIRHGILGDLRARIGLLRERERERVLWPVTLLLASWWPMSVNKPLPCSNDGFSLTYSSHLSPQGKITRWNSKVNWQRHLFLTFYIKMPYKFEPKLKKILNFWHPHQKRLAPSLITWNHPLNWKKEHIFKCLMLEEDKLSYLWNKNNIIIYSTNFLFC